MASGDLKLTQPRSQVSEAPVNARLASEARNTTVSAISSGVCQPGSACWAAKAPATSSSACSISVSAVST